MCADMLPILTQSTGLRPKAPGAGSLHFHSSRTSPGILPPFSLNQVPKKLREAGQRFSGTELQS